MMGGIVLKKIISFTFSLLLFGVIGVVVFSIYMRFQTLPVTTIIQNSEIYDNQGDLIDSIQNSQNRQLVALKDIAPHLINATLAIEDHRFYNHLGFDPQGMARAVITDLKSMSMEQGASTITQQLARNLYLNHERTWNRKLKEGMYAIQLEMQLSKDEILEKYLNQIYYGHSAYGIQAASRMFLGKDAKDLTLAESALLAGVPKGPRFYSPYLDMKNAVNRQKDILDAMVRYNYITLDEANKAVLEKIHIVPRQSEATLAEAPYFRDYVRKVAAEKLGITEAKFSSGGYIVHTTLNLKTQKAAEAAVTKQMNPKDELQAALLAIDPRTGYIQAMIGGKNYSQNQFNRVFATTRQPGSSFKPIVYLAALQNRFTAMTRYVSEPTVFKYDEDRKSYIPSNFGAVYENGSIDLRKAIAKSDNIYAVHTVLDVGAQKVIDLARLLGITSPLKPMPSLALGTYPVSPYEMAVAFGILANQGIKVEPTAIVRITDALGNPLYEANPLQTSVVDAGYTYVLTNLLQSVFEEGGTGYRVADLMKRPVAGKTGTTDTDAWMVGYTPELATAVWVGYDRDRKVDSIESRKAAPIFAEFTENALEAVPPKQFPIPDNVVTVAIDPISGKLGGDCPHTRYEAFVKGTEPTEICVNPSGSGVKPPVPSTKRSWWEDLKRWWND